MYEYIQGKYAVKTPTYVVIDVNGVGYKLNVSLNTYGAIESDTQGKLYVEYIVREDSQQFYGFVSELERFVFQQLVSVSGIGPNTARIVLSSMTAEETRSAILMDNEVAFKKVKGVGPKTAKRIILDLKDKMTREAGEDFVITPTSNKEGIKEEAAAALIALGFVKVKVYKALHKLISSDMAIETVEELIKKALKELS